jgi:hypothetical protein
MKTIRVFTVSVRETILANGEKTGEASHQEVVRAKSVSDAVKKVEKKLKDQHGELAANHEVVAVTLTYEIPDEE